MFAVTRSMAAADKITQALQASEGANPVPLESLPDMTQDENEHTVAQDTVPMVDHSSTSSPPSESSLSVTPSQLSISFPNFSFDGVTREKFMQLQRVDPLLKPLWEQAEQGNKAYFIANNILMSITTTLNHHSHALVPTSLRHSVLVAAHDGLGHGGIGATRAIINKYFTWPGMKKDITTHIESCNTCLLNNRGGHTKLPLCEPQVITERFEKLAIDVVGPLPITKRHFRYILTCIDLATSFPIAIPMRTNTAAETAQALLSIISCFGTPLTILSDQGSNFLSTTMSLLYQKLEISRIKTSPYRPQSNGTLERFYAMLKAMLRKSLDQQQHDWPTALDLVLHYARNIPHSRTGHTPFELTFAKPTPFILHTLKSLWTGDTDNTVNVPQFIADIESSWDGPYTIVALLPPVNCKLVPAGQSKAKPKVIHLSQIKKAPNMEVMRVVIVDGTKADIAEPTSITAQPMKLNEQQQAQLDNTLSMFPTVFTDKPGITKAISHSIKLSCTTPLWTPSYTVPLAHRDSFKNEIDSLLELGIIEVSHSLWSSPPIPITKMYGGVRILCDFRRLNTVTIAEPFLMPTIESIIAKVGNSTHLSKIDLLKEFYQVPMEEESKQYTAENFNIRLCLLD